MSTASLLASYTFLVQQTAQIFYRIARNRSFIGGNRIVAVVAMTPGCAIYAVG